MYVCMCALIMLRFCNKNHVATIQGKTFEGGNIRWLERKMVIRGKTLAIACLYTCIVSQHGHRFMGKHSRYSKQP